MEECADGRADALYNVALQMRDYRNVLKFRQWILGLESEPNPNIFLQSIEQARGYVSSLFDTDDDKKANSKMTIGVATPGFKLEQSKNMTLAEMKNLLPWNNRKLTFIRAVFEIASDACPFSNEISRVFGISKEVTRDATRIIDAYSKWTS